MNVMDDTLGDESGIPFLSSADDIPVHSTPIKGEKIPLPSTKNAMKHFMGQSGRHHDYSEVESLMSIRYSDQGQDSAKKGQGYTDSQRFDWRNYADRRNYDKTSSRKQNERNSPDLSNLDNLRPKMREHPSEKAFHHERSRSPKSSQRSIVLKQNDLFKKPNLPDQKDVDKRPTAPEQNDYLKRPYDKFSSQPYGYTERDSHFGSSDNSNKRYEIIDSETHSDDGRAIKNDQDVLASRRMSNSSKEQTKLSITINTRRYDSSDRSLKTNDKFDTNERSEKLENGQSAETDKKIESTDKNSSEHGNSSNEKKRVTISSPKYSSAQGACMNRSSSSSKQNTSLSELENTTLQKQRQEIQLLMTELKDRDRELSDMMKAHQQQLVAWQQDRDRLGMLERKCTQYEDGLRAKMNQLRTTVTNLKALKSTELEHRQELTHFKSTVEKLSTENADLKEEINEIQTRNTSLQENLTGLSTKVGRLEAREEELTTSLRLKEKDISSATGHMRELSERLQQLDLRCKECQDREKEALKDKAEWKKKFEQSREDFHTLSGELDRKRKDVVRLSEENKSARQQLSLLGKEACMMEKCKDELIESMRVKQERTDTQLRNLRELYDRQVQEVASLQIQLDNSKELIYRQQNSIDEQQLSSSYQGRGSHASEYSLERSSASQKNSWQRHKSSPTSKTRESDVTGSHHHTQSSGYQSQLYENQTAPTVAGTQATASSDSNYTNLAGSHRPASSSGVQSQLYENQSGPAACTQLTASLETNHADSTGSRLQEKLHYSQNQERIGTIGNKTAKYVSGSESSGNYGSNFSNLTDYKQPVKMLHSPTFENQSVSNRALSHKYDYKEDQNRQYVAYDKSKEHVIGENCCDINETNEEQSTPLADESSFHTPPRLKKKFNFDSPDRKDGFVKEQMQYRISTVSSLKDEQRNLGSGCENREDEQEKNKIRKQSDTLSNQVQTNSGNINGASSLSGQLNGENQQNTEQVANNFVGGHQAVCEEEFEKQYTFENKLTSFLDELDDIDDDSIWDEKPSKSFNLSMTESSPANKLRKLLIESQEMIHSLERSAESPRQIKIREQKSNQGKQQEVNSEDGLQQKSS